MHGISLAARRWLRPTRAVVAALIAIMAAGPARADPPAGSQPVLRWTAPAGCPDAAGFAAMVARYLGASTAATGVEVTVLVIATDTGFALTWRMEGADNTGERTLDGPDCALLAETAALTLALAIDPDAGADPAADDLARGDDERPPPAEVAEPTEVEIDRPARARRGRTLGVAARVGGGTTVGALPGAAASVGGALAARTRHFRVEGGFAYWFARRTTLPDQPDQGGDFSMYAGSFRVCGDLRGRWLAACVGGELGKMTGAGFGFDLPETNSSLWIGGTAGLAISWPLSKYLFLRADLEMAVPKDRPKFVLVQGGVVVHQQAVANGRLSAGLELQFP
jgi:hypothetical protein